MTTYPIQPSFARGEITPRLHARVDIDHYRTALAECRNFYTLRQGGLKRRAGFMYRALIKPVGNLPMRLFPFVFSASQAYLLEMGEGYMRFFVPGPNGGPVYSGGVPYEIATPWSSLDLHDLQFAQEADVAYFTHRSYPPFKLSRFSELNWTLTQYQQKDGPYLDIVIDGSTLTPSGTGNIVPTMIDNTTPSGVASASSNNVNACRAFDNDDTTDWDASDSFAGTHSTLRYDFPSAKIVNAYSIKCSNKIKTTTVGTTTIETPGSLRAPRTWSIEGSNDGGATWTTLQTRAGETGWSEGERRYYTFINPKAYSAYQLNIKSTNQGGTDPQSVSISQWSLAGGGVDAAVTTFTASAATSINGGSGFVANDAGRHIRFLNEDAVWAWYKILGVFSPTVCTATLFSAPLPSLKASASWRLGAFGIVPGWPARVCFFQQRLFFGRTDSKPQTIWGTRTGTYDDMSVSAPLVADDAISLTISDVGEIQWLAAASDLIVATASGIIPIGAANTAAGFGATNFQQGRKVRVGANSTRPIGASDSNIFVDHYNIGLHEMTYSLNSYGYLAPDVSVLSEHLLRQGVNGLSYAQKPNAIVWANLLNGGLVGMTYEKEQQMVALHNHTFDNDNSQVLSQCVIPGPFRDELWIAINRNGFRTIEQQQPDFEAASMAPAQAFYVDCGLTYTGAPTITVTGLPHPDGSVVAILADGAPEPQATVMGGSVTLPSKQPASTITVGFPMVSIATTLRIPTGGGDGSGLGRKKTVNEVILDLLECGNLVVKAKGRQEQAILRSTGDLMGQALPLMTGSQRVTVDDRWDNGGVVSVIVYDPTPATIRAITPAYESEP